MMMIVQKQFRTLCIGLITSLFICQFAIADTDDRQSTLQNLYDQSGVHSHLAWVHATVTDEAGAAWGQCANTIERTELDRGIAEVLSIDALQTSFLEELDQRIPEAQLAKIVEWTESETGKLIHQAEANSVDFDETKFQAALSDYEASGENTPERQTRLKHMLADTGAIYFLSAFNTEVSALVAMASVCTNDEDSLIAADKLVREERGAEALYRSFMRQELLVPSSIVYREISDAQLDAWSEFAKSEAGNTYYSALIKGTRSMLSAKVDRLRDVLEAMQASNK